MLLLSSIPHPTFDDCVIPAKALVAKYPFLADASKDGRTSHLSYYSIANASLFITFKISSLGLAVSSTLSLTILNDAKQPTDYWASPAHFLV